MKLEDRVIAIQNKEEDINPFIKQYKPFIKSLVSKTTHKNINNDDEVAVAMVAFSDAINSYDISKGKFLSFSKIIIRNRLIDYMRKNYKNNEVVFSDIQNSDDEDNSIIENLITDIHKQKYENEIKLEIQSITQELRKFGIEFIDLTDSSPKARKTKEKCAIVINYILSNTIILNKIIISKKLPIKIIEKNTYVPPKILDKFRKYIITATLILSGDYLHMKEYLSYIRKFNKEVQ